MTSPEEIARRITLLYDVAHEQGSLISLEELLPLLPQTASEKELAEAIVGLKTPDSRFELRANFVTEREKRNQGAKDQIDAERENRLAGAYNLRSAIRFVSLMHSNSFRIIAISGSTSYNSVSKSRDVDFFCVSPPGKSWILFTKALVLARFYRLVNSKAPPFCLSCVMDQGYAESTFTSNQGPLFARDALETKIMKGTLEYQILLERAGWMSILFPVAYAKRTTPRVKSRTTGPKPSPFGVFVNRLLFSTVGKYIRVKSFLLNRRFRASGEQDNVFEVLLAEDHLIYESRRYSRLRRQYSAVLVRSTGVQN